MTWSFSNPGSYPGTGSEPGSAADETSIAQYRTLVVLASRGPQRPVDVADALSAAGRMCDRLAHKGRVRRHRARTDRRSVLVPVTAAGYADVLAAVGSVGGGGHVVIGSVWSWAQQAGSGSPPTSSG